MPSSTHFQITRGNIIADCLPETSKFIQDNLSYLYLSLKRTADAAENEGPMTFISMEQEWTFACSVEKVELGSISKATGMLIEGNRFDIDATFEEIQNPTPA